MRDNALSNNRNHQYDQSETSEAPEVGDGTDTREGESEGFTPVEALLAGRASPRKRAVQAGLALLCLLAVVGLFRAITPLSIGPSASTPPASASSLLVRIQANLTFGSVTVDGKKLPGHPPFFFHAAPGGDTINFLALPFAPETCQVSWFGHGASAQLNSSGPSCDSSYTSGTLNGRGISSYVLEFRFSLGDLPTALQATALDFVRQVVTPVSLSSTVPAGQYYATGRDAQGMILSQRATTPLTAQVSLLLPTPQDLLSSSSWCLELICAGVELSQDPDATRGSVEEIWAIQIPLAMNWQFLLPDDQLVGMEHQSQVGSDTLLLLALDSHQQWHLGQYGAPSDLLDEQRQMIPSALCGTGIDELSNAMQDQQAGNQTLVSRSDHGLAGCEIQIKPTGGTAVGTLVWRFGVLLAADAKTQSAYPWLPLAPPAEVDAVGGG